jgi:hypothetical protein
MSKSVLAAALFYPPNKNSLVITLMFSPHIGSKDKSVDVLSVATQIDPIPRVLT